MDGATEKDKSVEGLALTSFFYLLCVGGYTQKRRKTNTRTIQFKMCDIDFKCGYTLITKDTTDDELMGATASILRQSNQQNGNRGRQDGGSSHGRINDVGGFVF